MPGGIDTIRYTTNQSAHASTMDMAWQETICRAVQIQSATLQIAVDACQHEGHGMAWHGMHAGRLGTMVGQSVGMLDRLSGSERRFFEICLLGCGVGVAGLRFSPVVLFFSQCPGGGVRGALCTRDVVHVRPLFPVTVEMGLQSVYCLPSCLRMCVCCLCGCVYCLCGCVERVTMEWKMRRPVTVARLASPCSFSRGLMVTAKVEMGLGGAERWAGWRWMARMDGGWMRRGLRSRPDFSALHHSPNDVS